MSPLIDLKNIQFSYGAQAPQVLDIKSFSINKGEKVFLFGPSGCGKTTFLEILAGVLVPKAGSYSFLNKDVVQMSAGSRDQMRAAHIGYIFQSFNLIPYLSVEENIVLPLHLSPERRKKVSQNSELQEAHNLCEQLGISALLSKPVTELSVGQQQRVAVARALLGKPELILADEPTSALDHNHREKFIELLFSVCKQNETTVLFVSHDRSLETLFDRSVSLQDINESVRK